MDAAPTDDQLFAALARHAAGDEARVVSAEITPLGGGFVSKAVERIELTLAIGGARSTTASYVRKACAAREVRALQMLAGLDGAEARPELVAGWISADRPDDQDASGFVSPFYSQETLHFGDPIPAPVIVTLARVHAACRPPAAFDWTWPYDAAHVDRLQQLALTALATSDRFNAPTADAAGWRARLEAAAASTALRQAAQSLPRTLTHGDMHPANLVRRADGSPVIIDWGNVCLAPPMLDLANIIELDSADWDIYVDTFRAAGGDFEAAVSERAFWWGRAVTALSYIPWAVVASTRTPDLIVQIEGATAWLAAS